MSLSHLLRKATRRNLDDGGPATVRVKIRIQSCASCIGCYIIRNDIDAVAAIGSGAQINLNSAVLFDFDKWELLPKAKIELDKIVSQIQKN